MSKKHNSKNPRPAAETVTEIEETVELVPENEESVVESTPVEEPIVALRGVVVDCNRLNVRVAPVMGATVVCEIARGTKVDVYQDKSTDAWYSVCTETGVEGFCMKKYISI